MLNLPIKKASWCLPVNACFILVCQFRAVGAKARSSRKALLPRATAALYSASSVACMVFLSAGSAKHSGGSLHEPSELGENLPHRLTAVRDRNRPADLIGDRALVVHAEQVIDR